MKNYTKVLLVFSCVAWITSLIITKVSLRESKFICHEQTHKLVYAFNGDTVRANVCRYSTKVFNLDSENIYFYYCEHINDSVHIKKVIPVGTSGIVKILYYK